MPEREPRTLQQYIDETPAWLDGTPTSFTPMTAMQWRIWCLASAGKFFEGLIVFITAIALPLIVLEFDLGPIGRGIVGAAPLFGILIGATALGGLADRLGRKPLFVVEMILFTVFVIAAALSPSFAWLVAFLFGIGMALGCDYPTAHLVISESIPSKSRGRLVLGAFAFQAVGALAGTLLGWVILHSQKSVMDWRWMYAAAILPAILVVIGRFFVTESAQWLVARGRIPEAERATERLLWRDPRYPDQVRLRDPCAGPGARARGRARFGELFAAGNRRATILASVPWFLQDLGTYGIGLFTPTILAATFGHTTDHERNLAEVIYNAMLAAEGTAFLDLLLLVGMIGAILLADRVGRIRLQITGFVGCAIGLFVAALSFQVTGHAQVVLVFAGFMTFNLMTNLGPNAMTYLIAGEVFPTHIRGMGAGFAASFAKLGAVLTAFFFPIVLNDIGTSTLLYTLVGAMLLGAIVTRAFAIETRGVNLETLGPLWPEARNPAASRAPEPVLARSVPSAGKGL